MEDEEILTVVQGAWRRFYSGEPMDAIGDLEAFQIRDPDEPTSLLSLGAMYYAAGFPLLGRTLIDKVALMASDDASVYVTLSWVQFADGDKEGAVQSLQKAEAALWASDDLPNNDIYRSVQAYRAYYRGDYAYVIEQFHDLEPLNDDNFYLHALVANSYFRVGDFNNAKRLSVPLVERSPKDPTLLWVLAASEEKLGRKGDALAG